MTPAERGARSAEHCHPPPMIAADASAATIEQLLEANRREQRQLRAEERDLVARLEQATSARLPPPPAAPLPLPPRAGRPARAA